MGRANAIKTANSLPEVQRFRWNAYYTFEDAEYSSTWNITYFDVVSSYNNQNITVSVQ